MLTLETLEQRFLKIADLSLDLSIFPIKQIVDTQVKTNKDKSKAHGEVFTPVWLVDKMIIKSLRNRSVKFPENFLDLCAGYGQFSIRWLRCLKKIYDKKDKPFDVEELLKNQIYFSELQLSSCYKLISIFGIDNINLFIGDATKLNKLNEEKYRGVYIFSSKKNKWINIDKIVCKIIKDEEYFVKSFEDKILPKI
jgi:hypothetical protein